MDPELRIRDEKEEKKRGGFFGFLRGVGRSFTGAPGGLGSGSGGFGGLGGLGWAGGLLATKAGLIGLVLIGTTVAGGLGVLGYKLFGPGDDDRLGGRFQLFAPRPPGAPSSGQGPGDGNSQSLSMLAAGNAGRGGPAEAAPDAAAVAAAEKQAADKAAAAAAAGKANNANVGGNKAAALKSERKIGELSKLGGVHGGGGAGSSASSSAAPLNAAKSALGSAHAVKPKATPSSQRSLGRRFGADNSLQQARQVLGNQSRAPSSGAAGQTYDGSRPAGIGGADAPQGGAGANNAGAGNAPTPNPSGGYDTAERFPPAPTAAAVNVTPWQGAINTAMLCVVGAAALLMAASKLKKGAPLLAMGLAALAAMLAMGAIMMGSMMMGGKYGQTFQGQMFVLAGTAMLASSALSFLPAPDPNAKASEFGDPALWMMVVGGAGLAAAMVGYISKPMKVDPSFFRNGQPPDWNQTAQPQSRYEAPSQRVLDRFLA